MERANVVALLLLIFLFVVWFYGPWQTLCVDWARERMFEARNALFDMAADRKLSFSSPEYRELRRQIELTIRFAHRISWPSLLVLYAFSRRIALRKQRSHSELVSRLPVEHQEEAQRHVDITLWATIRLIVLRSTVLLVLFVVIWILWRCGAPIYRFCKDSAEAMVQIVQDEAVALGEEEAAILQLRRRARLRPS